MSRSTNLKHDLSEHLLIMFSPSLENNLTEVREINEPIPGDGVGQVDDLLLHGVQAQHLHGTM